MQEQNEFREPYAQQPRQTTFNAILARRGDDDLLLLKRTLENKLGRLENISQEHEPVLDLDNIQDDITTGNINEVHKTLNDVREQLLLVCAEISRRKDLDDRYSNVLKKIH